MATDHQADRSCGEPSMQDRITALHSHNKLLDTIPEHPQAAICKQFSREFALITYYNEGEVHQSRHAVETFLRNYAEPGGMIEDEERLGEELRALMSSLSDDLFFHGTCLVLDDLRGTLTDKALVRAIQDFNYMASSHVPSKMYMDLYRTLLGSNEGVLRAANGELLCDYGQVGDPIPSDMMAMHDDDLEPLTQFLIDRLLNPFFKYIGGPFRHFICKKPELKEVNTRTISTVAKAVVCILAILSLATPIGTLNVIEQPTLRIVVMALFAQAFAASVQCMGSRAVPVYMLITA